MNETQPPLDGHRPRFITGPGQTDVLFVVTVVLLIGIVLITGNLYFRLHALPEQMAHKTNKAQMEIVAVLALLALFTHNHLYWIAALLLAFVQLPDFTTPIASMARSLANLARSLAKLARGEDRAGKEVPPEELAEHRREEETQLVSQAKRLTDKLEARG